MMTTETLKHDALGTTRLVHAGDDARSSSATRARRTRRCAGSRAGSRHARRQRWPRSPASRASRDCSRSTGTSCAAATLPGAPLYEAPPRSRAYFVDALRVLRRLHRAGIAHNDLAKEANWLVAGERCAIVDFQLATRSRTRTARFRRRAYEDLRHLLKHKRTYQPQRLTARQRRVLARPTLPTRLWRVLAKPVVSLRDALRARLARARRARRAPRLMSPEPRRASARMRCRSLPPLRHGHLPLAQSEQAARRAEAIRHPRQHRGRTTPSRACSDWAGSGITGTRRAKSATRALADMASEHLYSRRGDKPTLVFEAVEQQG